MLSLFGRRQAQTNRRTVDNLHEAIVSAARSPGFYRELGVADTFEGRFEILTLTAGIVLRRLSAAEAPGPEVAQRLVDTLFRHLDPALREMGVGDLAVPKRMKRLASAFLGRNAAYEAALRQGGDDLAPVLSRNIFDGATGGEALARYVVATTRFVDDLSLDDLLRGPLRFPDPALVG